MAEQDDPGRRFRPGRRRFLGYVASAVAAGAVDLASKPGQAAGNLADLLAPRALSFFNVHTTERLAVPYGIDGKVVPAAMPAVCQLLHDHHDGSLHEIDSRLLDLLFVIVRSVGGGGSGGATLQVLSGYRSPHTNSMLRLSDESVAVNSFHMRGQAIDFWIPGCPLMELHRAALAARGGGVGYYPAHNFIHVDVGPVRQWNSFGWTAARPVGGLPAGHESLMIDGRLMHLTPIQARTLAMHRRALLWDRQHRKLFGR
jgi:uncharacterized protein YcbK (DUF882 family)